MHPSVDDITVEGIMHALSDPLRVQIFLGIAYAQCAQTCSTYLEISEQAIPKSTLSQHFKALRESGLIRSERKGVEIHNSSRCEEIDQRFPGLISAIIDAHKIQSERKRVLERRKKLKAAA
ncbi:MAG TPA: helix-turn-helix domain-containing protein [Burkholderiales bacterium]|jgi:DNA-binding transcriptional ArsR family regulator|nr:helix-turn-helix domain-containing protein [Burkholderiales bacterium]